MNRVHKLFKTTKPIIALLHLLPLPGDPEYDRQGGMRKVINRAREELKALQYGGVDGVMIANEFSLPYQSPAPAAIVAAMANIIGELRAEVKIPFGVNIVQDPVNCIELAGAVEADFARSMFTSAYVGIGGIRQTSIASVMRRKVELNLNDMLMFYMVNPESDVNLGGTDNVAIAKSLIFNCQPDAMCISGRSAGNNADLSIIEQVKAVSNGVPVFCNTGCNIDNVENVFSVADGAFVGTGIKVDRKFRNTVDPVMVEKFMRKVETIRNGQ